MIGALLVAVLLAAGMPVARRPRRSQSPTAVADLSALLSLGLDGGMSLHAALRWSIHLADPSLQLELSSVLRKAAHQGLAPALRAAAGPSADLLRSLARPVDTGAAVGPVLVGLRERLEAEYLGEVETSLERLPVKLVLPLALLMLPGLLLMIVAPALIDAISRLG